jgi:hypothetical protein
VRAVASNARLPNSNPGCRPADSDRTIRGQERRGAFVDLANGNEVDVVSHAKPRRMWPQQPPPEPRDPRFLGVRWEAFARCAASVAFVFEPFAIGWRVDACDGRSVSRSAADVSALTAWTRDVWLERPGNHERHPRRVRGHDPDGRLIRWACVGRHVTSVAATARWRCSRPHSPGRPIQIEWRLRVPCYPTGGRPCARSAAVLPLRTARSCCGRSAVALLTRSQASDRGVRSGAGEAAV